MRQRTEVYRPLKVSEIGAESIHVTLETDATERAAVAERLGLDALAILEGDIDVRKAIGRQYVLEGTIRAEFTQACVVSGDPVTSKMTFPVRRVFDEEADAFDGLAEDDEHIVSSIEDDDPEPLIDEEIDAGEAAVEELALQIPPYPRREDAVFEQFESGPPDTPSKKNPFAALEALKNPTKTND